MVNNKKILIIGGTGSLGHALVRRLQSNNELFVMSRDETKQWEMQNRLYGSPIRYVLCDLRNLVALKAALINIKPDIIINAAAMKQVPACEIFPHESIATNIEGVQNLIRVCTQDISPEVVLGVSTDKACKPINVYGMCKSIGERVYVAANNPEHRTKFLCIRYGNVVESRGSIVPLFKHQSRTSKIYTITTEEMTRFFITLDESVDLIMTALTYGKAGDTLVPKLRSGKIVDLADIFIQEYGGERSVIGIRPGEKIHEELISEEEFIRTFQLQESYLVIKPMISQIFPRYSLSYFDNDGVIPPAKMKRLSSDSFLLSKEKLHEFLIEAGTFNKSPIPQINEEVKF